jgi:molybdopterin-biosynthesis enzyme MoeA-like protein
MALDRRFILRQTAALLELGIPIADVERSLTWLEQRIPEGADPATWIPTPSELFEEPAGQAAFMDARQNWYLRPGIPSRFRRLLDAKEA